MLVACDVCDLTDYVNKSTFPTTPDSFISCVGYVHLQCFNNTFLKSLWAKVLTLLSVWRETFYF